DLAVLEFFLKDYDPSVTDSWDNHYIYFNLPFRSLWIGERAFVIFLLVIASLILFIITYFSFVGKNKQLNKNKLKNAWYMIPLTLGTSFFSLYTGQGFTFLISFMADLSPFVQFGIKFIFSILFISALFIFQEHKKINIDAFVYGYTLTLISIANIFIFSAVDLMLLFVFFIEYLIIYLSRAASKSSFLIMSLIAMCLPFSPYIANLIFYGNGARLSDFVFSSFSMNLLLATGLFPIQIMWLRLLHNISAFQKSRGYTRKRLVMTVTVTTSTLVTLAMMIFAAIGTIASYAQEIHVSVNREITEDPDSKNITLAFTKKTVSGLTNYNLTVRSSRQALRYELSLTGDESVPLFDSLYEYKISDEQGKAVFTVPDYPPQKISLDFSSESKVLDFCIRAFYQDDSGTITSETRTVRLNEEKA
ncbi:MAG: hypothetical protein J6Y93_04890, partial [Treponema sp.]|nr:hypothetical protein [Treponema sp.]